jgi:hypothetical protein
MCGLNTTPGVVVVVVVVVVDVAVAAVGRCCWLHVVVAGLPVCRSTIEIDTLEYQQTEKIETEPDREN